MKDPEERKEEILNAAEELFIKKGYEHTSVNDIAVEIGVAKGLFYYYFKTKEEILNTISQKYIRSITINIKTIVNQKEKNAIEKIHLIFEIIVEQFGLKRKGIKRLAMLFNNEKNLAMHSRMANIMIEEIKPYVISIIKQGVQENLFATQYPEFTAETLLMWAAHLHNTVKVPVSCRDANLKAKAAEDMLEKILGAKHGSLNLSKYFISIIDELSSL